MANTSINIYPKYNNFVNLVTTWLLLMLANCNCTSCGKKPSIGTPAVSSIIENKEMDTTINEVIVFIGNPGVGKSSLLNAILQKPIFSSGANAGTGLTKQEEAYYYENKLYVDTPGLDDIDMELKYQVASEIEKALKHSNNYKVIFVITLEGGRIKSADLVTINTVCKAINTEFEYGLIINKATEASIKTVNEAGGIAKLLEGKLNKQPSAILTLSFAENIHDKEDRYFSEGSPNREKLVRFINQLAAKRIDQANIDKLNVRDYNENVQAMEKAYKDKLESMRKQVESLEEEKRRQAQRHKEEIDRMEKQ
jgi:GTP-binding protein EngB required for normal cell division